MDAVIIKKWNYTDDLSRVYDTVFAIFAVDSNEDIYRAAFRVEQMFEKRFPRFRKICRETRNEFVCWDESSYYTIEPVRNVYVNTFDMQE